LSIYQPCITPIVNFISANERECGQFLNIILSNQPNSNIKYWFTVLERIGVYLSASVKPLHKVNTFNTTPQSFGSFRIQMTLNLSQQLGFKDTKARGSFA